MCGQPNHGFVNVFLIRLFLLPAFLLTIIPVIYAAEILHIGVTLSMTGRYAGLGTMMEKAYKSWERDVNRKGGLLGRPVKLTILDDKSDPRLGKELYQNLIVHELVDFVLGPYSSEITEAVSSVTEQHRYPLLAAGASADSLWQRDRKHLFGIHVSRTKFTVGFLELLAKADVRKVAIVSANDVFSMDIEIGSRGWARRFSSISYSLKFIRKMRQILK